MFFSAPLDGVVLEVVAISQNVLTFFFGYGIYNPNAVVVNANHANNSGPHPANNGVVVLGQLMKIIIFDHESAPLDIVPSILWVVEEWAGTRLQ